MYLSQPQQLSGSPVAVRTYVVDPSTSQLTITSPHLGITVEGSGPFYGVTDTTPNTLWVKVGWPPLCDTNCTVSKFNHMPINNANGALFTVFETSTPDEFDMLAKSIATSDHFLLLLDGVATGNKVLHST